MREPSGGDRRGNWLGAPGPLLADALNPQLVELCTAVVNEMTAVGIELSGVYLQAGTSLRCYATEGYRQFFDGIGEGVGIIGSVWQSGQAAELHNIPSSASYRAAVPDVTTEICVPVIVDGECVGAINAESTGELPDGTRELLDRLASTLASELEPLGPLRPSMAQVLLTHATRLAASHDAGGIAERLLEAAVSVSGLANAVLLLGQPVWAAASTGPLGTAIASLPNVELTEVDLWVAHGGSSRTAPVGDGFVLHGQQALIDLGARSLLVVALGRGHERLGSVLLADERDVAITLATAEALELVGELAAANLRSARAMVRLRHAASTDALTGLGHRATFDTALQEALHRKDGVAVLILDLDGFKAINDTQGHAAGDQLLKMAAETLGVALRQGDQLFRIGGDEFAALVPVHSDAEAETIARRLVDAYRAQGFGTVSVGIAVACPEDTPEELVRRADTALYETKRAGRDGVTLA